MHWHIIIYLEDFSLCTEKPRDLMLAVKGPLPTSRIFGPNASFLATKLDL